MSAPTRASELDLSAATAVPIPLRIAVALETLAAGLSSYQPLNSGLTAIAELGTTSFGRALLALANAAELRTAAGLVLGTDIYSKSGADLAFQPITIPQALSGAGAVNLTTSATAFTSTGSGQALTLANGTNGQIKSIAHVVDGGSGVLTPTTKSGYSTITFTNVGDAVTLQYFTTAGWIIIGQNGVIVAP